MTKLGIWTIVTIFAVSMTVIPALAAGHVFFDDVTITQQGKNGALSVHIDTKGMIPLDPSSDFGWAVPANSGGGFLVIATHGGVGDDSSGQTKKTLSAYHTHFLTAEVSGPNCGTSPHATSATINEVGKLKIMDDEIWVTNIPKGHIDELTASGTFSFMLEAIDGDLCINVVNTVP